MLALVACNNLSGQSYIHMLICLMRQSSMQSKAFLKVSYVLGVDLKVLITRRL